jgi:hypothetical protein
MLGKEALAHSSASVKEISLLWDLMNPQILEYFPRTTLYTTEFRDSFFELISTLAQIYHPKGLLYPFLLIIAATVSSIYNNKK